MIRIVEVVHGRSTVVSDGLVTVQEPRGGGVIAIALLGLIP